MFNDEQFASALEELDHPDLDGYEFFVQCNDIKIYRKHCEETGLYEYKMIGTLDCDTETCKRVYMDLVYRKKWDSYVKELYEDTHEGIELIYWNVNFPFPMSNRDYTYVRECRHPNDNTWVILSQAHPLSGIPEKKKVIRVNSFKQFLILQKMGENKTRAFMQYFDNPGGKIPTWLINWAAQKGVPGFLTDMTKACSSYENYLAKKE